MKRVWYLLLAISLGANAGFAVVWLTRQKPRPQQPPGPGGRPAIERVLEQHLDRLSEGLGLSEGQRTRLTAAYEILFPRILEQNRAVAKLRRQVHLDYGADSVDSAAFRDLVRRLSHEQERLDSLVAEAMIEEAAALTPEQRRHYIPQMPWTRAVQTAQGEPADGPRPHRRPGPRHRLPGEPPPLEPPPLEPPPPGGPPPGPPDGPP